VLDDVAGNRPGRHCSPRYRMAFNSRIDVQDAFDDAASSIRQSLPPGGEHDELEAAAGDGDRAGEPVLARQGGAGSSLTTGSPRVDGAWFQRLKLKNDEPLSHFAFKFNLGRYSTASASCV